MGLKCIILENNPDQEVRHAAVEKAVRDYLKEDVHIRYSAKGKPSIIGCKESKYVSVTTTGDKMLVAVFEGPVGVDGEYLPRYEGRKTDFAALAERFFSGDEAEYVRTDGEESEKEKFMKIWVRKEAYVKCIEKTIADFPSFSVVEGDRILNRIGNVNLRKLTLKFEGSEDYIFAIAGV